MTEVSKSSKAMWDKLGVHTCDRCNLKTTDMGFFQAHACRTATAMINYNIVRGLFCCSLCRTELAETPFEEHLEQHLTLKPYSCYYCNELFKTREDVCVHVKKHIGSGSVGFETCILRVTKRTKEYMIKAKSRGKIFFTPKNASVVPTPFGIVNQSNDNTLSAMSSTYRSIAPKPPPSKSLVKGKDDHTEGGYFTPDITGTWISTSPSPTTPQPRSMPFYPHTATDFHKEGNLSFHVEPPPILANETCPPEYNTISKHSLNLSKVAQDVLCEKEIRSRKDESNTSPSKQPQGIFKPFTHDSSFFLLIRGHFICLNCKQKWNETTDFIRHIWLYHLHEDNSLHASTGKFSLRCEELQLILKTLHGKTTDETLSKQLSHFIIYNEEVSQPHHSHTITCEQSTFRSLSMQSHSTNGIRTCLADVLGNTDNIANSLSRGFAQKDPENGFSMEPEGNLTQVYAKENSRADCKRLLSSFYQCGFSNCVFSSHLPVDLLIHNENIHAMEADIPCVYCGKMNKTATGLLEHLDSHVGQNGEKAMLICSLMHHSKAICIVEHRNVKKIFHLLKKAADRKTESALDQNNFLQYRCNLCASDFLTLEDLRGHLIYKSLLKVVACKYCRGHFLDSESWHKHMSRDHPREVKVYRINEKLLCKDRKSHSATYEELLKQRKIFRSTLHQQQSLFVSSKLEEPHTKESDDNVISKEQQVTAGEKFSNIYEEMRADEFSPEQETPDHGNELNTFTAKSNGNAQINSPGIQEKLDTYIAEENTNAQVDTCVPSTGKKSNTQASPSDIQTEMDTCLALTGEKAHKQENASDIEEEMDICLASTGENANTQVTTPDIQEEMDTGIASTGEKAFCTPVDTPDVLADGARLSGELSMPIHFRCSVCPCETFSSYFLAKKHKKVHSNRKAAIRRFPDINFHKSKKYKCKYCSHTCVGDKAVMVKHLRSSHKYYVCVYCGDYHPVKRFMENHQKYRHTEKEKKVEVRYPNLRTAFRLDFENNCNSTDTGINNIGESSRKRLREAEESDQPICKQRVIETTSTSGNRIHENSIPLKDSTKNLFTQMEEQEHKFVTFNERILSNEASSSLHVSPKNSRFNSTHGKEQSLEVDPVVCGLIPLPKTIKETRIRSVGSPSFNKPQEISIHPKLLYTSVTDENQLSAFEKETYPNTHEVKRSDVYLPSTTSCGTSNSIPLEKAVGMKNGMSISDFPFQCFICKVCMKSIQYVLDHIRWLHPNDQNNSLVFDRRYQIAFTKEGVVKKTRVDLKLLEQKHLCTACSFIGDQRTDVIKHVKLVHASKDSEKCVLSIVSPFQAEAPPLLVPENSDDPQSVAVRSTQVNKHEQIPLLFPETSLQDSSQPLQVPPRSLRYICHLCSDVLCSEFYFKLHLATHECFTCTSVLSSMDGLLFCCVCGYVARSNTDLAQHTDKHLTERRYACSHCDADDHKKTGLQNHIRKYHSAHQDAYVIDREIRRSEGARPKIVDIDPSLKVEDVFKIPSTYLNKRLRQAGVKSVLVDISEETGKTLFGCNYLQFFNVKYL